MRLRIVRKMSREGIIQLNLAGEMTVYSIKKLKEILLRELVSAKGITVSLAEVDDVDTSGYQMLVFLRREARKSGKLFKVTDMSSRLKSIFNLYRETF